MYNNKGTSNNNLRANLCTVAAGFMYEYVYNNNVEYTTAEMQQR